MSKKEFRIEAPAKWTISVAVRGYVGEQYVGKALLTRKGNIATLADIVIENIRVPIFSFTIIFKTRRDQRRKGYGSLLLDATIEYCRGQNIENIEGEVLGDSEHLIPWYRRHGFRISDGNKISMNLNA